MPDRGPKDSTGLARQIVKFTCNTIPATPNSQLPMLLEKNLVRIIWSALTCDLPPEDFLGGILSLNEVLDQDVENEMRGFILNKVYANGEALTALGAQETRPCIPTGCMERTWAKAPAPVRRPPYLMYASYKLYCIDHAYEACSWSKFGTQFMITLRSLRVQVTKVRKSGGRFLKSVSLTEGKPVSVPDKSFAEELRGKDPFNSWDAQEEGVSISPQQTEELVTDSRSVEERPVPEPGGWAPGKQRAISLL